VPGVDVVTGVEIARPREEVAAYTADPDNAPAWYQNISAVRWVTEPPLQVGSEVEFTANFLGRKLVYTYQVSAWTPGERFVMRTERPFPMETTYEWEDGPDESTHMRVRNRGQPTGFASVTTPVLVAAMRRANRKDIGRLKALLEQSS